MINCFEYAPLLYWRLSQQQILQYDFQYLHTNNVFYIPLNDECHLNMGDLTPKKSCTEIAKSIQKCDPSVLDRHDFQSSHALIAWYISYLFYERFYLILETKCTHNTTSTNPEQLSRSEDLLTKHFNNQQIDKFTSDLHNLAVEFKHNCNEHVFTEKFDNTIIGKRLSLYSNIAQNWVNNIVSSEFLRLIDQLTTPYAFEYASNRQCKMVHYPPLTLKTEENIESRNYFSFKYKKVRRIKCKQSQISTNDKRNKELASASKKNGVVTASCL